MPRPTIHCPQCHRELFNLHHPRCLWCGAEITAEQFALVAAPPSAAGSPSQQPIPILPPLYPGPSYGIGFSGLGGFRRLNPFSAINGSISPWERKLRIAGAALAVCLVTAKLVYVLWVLWQVH